MAHMSQSTMFRHGSTRASHNFAVTVKHVSLSKQIVFELLTDLCESLVVSEEGHNTRANSLHHHVYMKTRQEHKISDIRRIIYTIYHDNEYASREQEERVYVATVRKMKHYLKYITKEDTSPLFFGINDHDLSFAYKAIKWAENTDEYKASDPFVLSHPNYYKLLEQVHAAVKSESNACTIQPLRVYEHLRNEHEHQELWKLQVIDWWNDWVRNGWHHKKKQLYLHGPPNTGKTYFIDHLLQRTIGDSFNMQVFTPAPSEHKFAWADFEPNVHNVLKIDEFNLNEFNVNELKKAMEGQEFTINRKFQKSKRVHLRMPMIFISNLRPPSSDMLNSSKSGFAERVIVVDTTPTI